jgi:hypothetical protein
MKRHNRRAFSVPLKGPECRRDRRSRTVSADAGIDSGDFEAPESPSALRNRVSVEVDPIEIKQISLSPPGTVGPPPTGHPRRSPVPPSSRMAVRNDRSVGEALVSIRGHGRASRLDHHSCGDHGSVRRTASTTLPGSDLPHLTPAGSARLATRYNNIGTGRVANTRTLVGTRSHHDRREARHPRPSRL